MVRKVASPAQPVQLMKRVVPFGSAVIVVVFGAITYWSARREDRSVASVEHTNQIMTVNRHILTRTLDAETGVRGFLITGDSTYLQPYSGAAADINADLITLRSMTGDNPRQQVRLQALSRLVQSRFASFDQRTETRRTEGFDSVRAAMVRAGVGRAVMDTLRHVVAQIEAEERTLLEQRKADLDAHEASVLWIVAIGTIVAAALATLINLMLSRYAATQEALTHQLQLRTHDLEELNDELHAQADVLEEQAVELEQLNEVLEERTHQAEEANATKAKFLASMSHDLRTPLNAIIGYTDLMDMGLRGPLTDVQSSDLNRIRHSSKHLLSMINDVLNFAKIEAGRIELHMEEVSVREAMREIEGLVLPQVKAKELQFGHAECDPGLQVTADREKLNQVLVNLVTNAMKFTPGGGRIYIGCRDDGASVQLDVADTGPGIAADQLQSIFAPFVQLNGYTARAENQGVGLGLAICRELARAMNGELTVSSVVGEGSTFTLRLPRSVPAHLNGKAGAV